MGSHLPQYNNQKDVDKFSKIQQTEWNSEKKFWQTNEKEIQLRFHNIVSKPALQYGSECWTLRQRDKSRINSSLIIFLRSLSGVTLRDRIKSEEIRKKWNVEERIDDIQNYQLKWNQHVLRMPENRIPRKALQYRRKGKRDLRRP